jgi:hypothetical protein
MLSHFRAYPVLADNINDLVRVQDILGMVRAEGSEVTLQSHLPPNRLLGRQIHGKYAMDLGTEAILDMRQYMQAKSLSDELVQKIMAPREARILSGGLFACSSWTSHYY